MSHVHGREGHHYFSDAPPPAEGGSGGVPDVGPRPLPERLWDEYLDRLATLAANMTGCPVARISVFDHQHVICRASIGAPRLVVPRAQSFCARAMTIGGTVISDAPSQDERFADLAVLPHNQGVRFYLAHPMVNAQGVVIGILSLRDVLPHTMDQTQLAVLNDIAALAVERLSSHPLPPQGVIDAEETSLHYLNMVEKTVHMGYWRCLPVGRKKMSNQLACSGVADSLLGWENGQPKTYFAFLRAVVPNERQRVAIRIHRAIRRAIPFTIEASLVGTAEKDARKVSIHGEFGPDGFLVGLIWLSR